MNKRQDDVAENDAVAMGVGMVLFWPALFFIESDDHSAEVARLKGEVEAIEIASIQKDCSSLSEQIVIDRRTAAELEAQREAERRRQSDLE